MAATLMERTLTDLARQNTLMREALKRIAQQLEPNGWDASIDGPATIESYTARLPHIAKFAADMAENPDKRPGFKEFVYSKIANAASA